ncbi:hypothetical protein C8D88_117127 [Lentzea atacamensis]|uniref:Uncharacterized protein n=1 Tax=Lentzea atacamensis TaxID=531938 RepID=A0A316HND1_9PSEU|nr:hypothetical protein C8D88_117127 [Lentzea atacamensis]
MARHDPTHALEPGHGRARWSSTGWKSCSRSTCPYANSIDLTDPASPAELWRNPLPAGLTTDFTYSPDGSLFAAFDSTQTLRLWRVRDRKPAGDPVNAAVGGRNANGKMAFSPDGKRIALTAVERRGSDFVTRPEIWDVSDPDTPSSSSTCRAATRRPSTTSTSARTGARSRSSAPPPESTCGTPTRSGSSPASATHPAIRSPSSSGSVVCPARTTGHLVAEPRPRSATTGPTPSSPPTRRS